MEGFPAIVYMISKLPDYKDSTMNLFIKTFNFKRNTIDKALVVIAKSLGHEVSFAHVKCRVSGTNHIRFRLKHKKHTGITK